MNDPIGARAFAEGDWARFRHLEDLNLSELDEDAARGQDSSFFSRTGFAVGPFPSSMTSAAAAADTAHAS